VNVNAIFYFKKRKREALLERTGTERRSLQFLL
jgi:hypothetical protein